MMKTDLSEDYADLSTTSTWTVSNVMEIVVERLLSGHTDGRLSTSSDWIGIEHRIFMRSLTIMAPSDNLVVRTLQANEYWNSKGMR